MSENPIKNRVQRIRGLYISGLSNIAAWNENVPVMKETEEVLAWVDNTISSSPVEIVPLVNETLIDYLDKSEQAVSVLNNIPKPPLDFMPIQSTAGSSIVSSYTEYVEQVIDRFHDQPKAVEWGQRTLFLGQQLKAVRYRSDIVRRRLIQLNPFLGELHKRAVDATLTAEAGTQNPIEAAAAQNRLLEQFKGALIAKCRTGKGTNYERISSSLAANAPLTKTVVADGQGVYDSLNNELVEIRKQMGSVKGERMGQLLRLLEEHIIVITDALDPNQVGIVFSR